MGRGDKLLVVIKYLMFGAAFGFFPFAMAAMAAQFWFGQTVDDVEAWPWHAIFSIAIPVGCVLGLVMLGREIIASYARLRRKQRYENIGKVRR